MTSFAQAYQDLYALAMLDRKRDGTYLDIGCYVAKDGNNTFLMDRDYGWDGISVDLYDFNFRSEMRRGHFLTLDATQHYPSLMYHLRDTIAKDGIIDYLSLDVDEATNEALRVALNFSKYRVITVEHDVYARGEEERQRQRNQLTEAGYILHVPSVHIPNDASLIFEDWWISQEISGGVHIYDQGPHDAAKVVQDLWLSKFGENLNIYMEPFPVVEIHEQTK